MDVNLTEEQVELLITELEGMLEDELDCCAISYNTKRVELMISTLCQLGADDAVIRYQDILDNRLEEDEDYDS